MLDGLYASIICFFMAYLLFVDGNFVTDSGLNINDLERFGVYVGPAAVMVINLYILINTYRWDWLMALLVAISILLIFFWTGVYSAFTVAAYFYKAAPQTFGQATFWAVTCLSVIISLMPRFCIKVIQKIYFPRDIDIIREQVRQGKFAHLDLGNRQDTIASVDEDQRPIYPPSVAPTATTHNHRSQYGSDGTMFTRHGSSPDPPLPQPSAGRIRPSFESIRGSMDRMRPSYEQSSDFTSAAMLTRIESSNSFSPVQSRR